MSITEKGRQAVLECVKVFETVDNQMLQGFSQEDQAQLMRYQEPVSYTHLEKFKNRERSSTMANTRFLSFFSCFMSYAPFFPFVQGYLCRFILFWYFYYSIQFFYIVIFFL